ncbi:MAG: hypothetical protein ACKO2V_01950, partial [Snowella sp.]
MRVINQFPVYNKVFDEFNFCFIHPAILLCFIYLFSSRFDNPASKRRLDLVSVEDSSGKRFPRKKALARLFVVGNGIFGSLNIAKLSRAASLGKGTGLNFSEVLNPVIKYHDNVNASFSNDPEKIQKMLADKYKYKDKI